MSQAGAGKRTSGRWHFSVSAPKGRKGVKCMILRFYRTRSADAEERAIERHERQKARRQIEEFEI